ncbi:Glycoside hydrolase, family 31 [Corchorus olitorius]|uniref:Glycoside hydrolase, family 31 n=1 Tax=Corchorus olitorius TaxID=93759 RepID=A0A1R3KUX3_9ROSI|nr:Glycoside hydrolase, family 31 [Corchorus olitorius]
MARSTYEGMKLADKRKRPFVLTRAGYIGSQRYAATWTEDASDGRYPLDSKISSNANVVVPEMRKKPTLTTRSTSLGSSFATTARKRNTSKETFQEVNGKKPLDQKLEIAVPYAASLTGTREYSCKEKNENVSKGRNNENIKSAKSEIRRALFNNKNSDDKMHNFGCSKSGSRVAPCHEETPESTVVVGNSFENLHANHKDCENLSVIRSQLVEIEKQQSSLLDLLQRFICSSQTGMHSLESRVHGLELALDDISNDLAVSNRRISTFHRTTCCLLPAAGFLSSKFWRKREGRYSTSRFSVSRSSPVVGTRFRADRNWNAEAFKLENHRLRLHGGGGGLIMNPLAEIDSDAWHLSQIAHQ